MAANPLMARITALAGQASRGSQVPDDPTLVGAGNDGGSIGSAGKSSSDPISPAALENGSSSNGPIPSLFAPVIGPPATGQISAEDKDPNVPAVSFSGGPTPGIRTDSPNPKLMPQGPKNKLLNILSRATGMTAKTPEPGQPYTGPIGAEDKARALGGFLTRLSNGYEENFGTPFDRELMMQRKQLANEAAWRAAMIGVRAQANDINQQKADTAQSKVTGDMRRYGYTLNDPTDPNSGFRSMSEPEILADPELGLKFNTQMSKMGLTDAQTDKIRDMLMGRYEVDPWIAAVSGDPTRSGQKISAQQYQNINKVLQAKGIQIKDLGTEGLWAVDRIGNKIHEVSPVSPSVARAQMYSMLRPVQAISPEGNLQWMTAGNAISQGAAPAGPGSQAISKQAQLKDIYGGISSVRSAIAALPEEQLSTTQLAELQSILREPSDSLRDTMWTNFIGSQNLGPEEQDFVVALQQLRERALSVRNLASMGVGSDQQRAAVWNTLPGLLSGNKQMMMKQLNAFTNFVDNLATGVPTVGKGKQSPSPGNHGTGTKPATKAQVQQYAAQKGITVDQATQEFKAAGYSVK